MSHLPRTSMIPPMPYVSKVKRDEMKTVKLKHVSGLVTKEKKVPVFDGKDGIEGLLYCEETVREAFDYLAVTNGIDMFNLYKETLAGNAVRKWNNVAGSIPNQQRTANRFDTAIKAYYDHYVDNKARNVMYEYLKSQECGKPFKSTVYDHVDRMEELYRYAAKLPGTVPALDDTDPDDAAQIKEHIYVTFPERWQDAFEDSHDIEQTSQVEVNRFMNRQRVKDAKQAKRQDDKKKKSNGKGEKNGKSNGENKKRNGPTTDRSNGKKAKKQVQPTDTCPIHGGHKWLDCFDNKYGPNFRPPRSSGGGNQSGRSGDRRRQESHHYGNDHYHQLGMQS